MKVIKRIPLRTLTDEDFMRLARGEAVAITGPLPAGKIIGYPDNSGLLMEVEEPEPT